MVAKPITKHFRPPLKLRLSACPETRFGVMGHRWKLVAVAPRSVWIGGMVCEERHPAVWECEACGERRTVLIRESAFLRYRLADLRLPAPASPSC